MDSVLNFFSDRIYRINWIIFISGSRMKPEIQSPLRGKGFTGGRNQVSQIISIQSKYPNLL
jgi:hypothetical protein